MSLSDTVAAEMLRELIESGVTIEAVRSGISAIEAIPPGAGTLTEAVKLIALREAEKILAPVDVVATQQDAVDAYIRTWQSIVGRTPRGLHSSNAISWETVRKAFNELIYALADHQLTSLAAPLDQAAGNERVSQKLEQLHQLARIAAEHGMIE